MSAPLAAAVFGSAWAAEYIGAARAAAQRELARDSLSEPHHTDGPNGTWYIPAFGRWQCQLEDATIGYAVHATAAALDATLLELNGLVVDVKNEWSDARRWGADALRRELGRYLVLHKYVGIEAELQRMEAKEDAENAHNLAGGAIRRNITHLRDLASVRRRVRDALDAGVAAAAAASRALGCTSSALKGLRDGGRRRELRGSRCPRASRGGASVARCVRPATPRATHTAQRD